MRDSVRGCGCLVTFADNHLRFPARLAGVGHGLGVLFEAGGHGETPFVLDLATEIQVDLADQEAIADSGEARSAAAMGRGDVA